MKNVIAEVGVGHLGVAYGALLWDNPNNEILMFEPNIEYFKDVEKAANNRPNVKLFNVAIGDVDGEMDFFLRETSSYLSSLNGMSVIDQSHPHLHRENDCVKVNVFTFDRFDPGNINYLRIDVEGGEWFVLKHLKSRPETISIETHDSRASYINPYLWEIEQWMGYNGYEKIAVDEMDSIYKKTNKYQPLSIPVKNLPNDIAYYREIVSKFILSSYFKYYFNSLDYNSFILNINKINFQKSDVLDRLAKFIKDSAEKDRDIDRSVRMFDGFIISLIKDIDRTDY
jgi:FkbM family methyltransferase